MGRDKYCVTETKPRPQGLNVALQDPTPIPELPAAAGNPKNQDLTPMVTAS